MAGDVEKYSFSHVSATLRRFTTVVSVQLHTLDQHSCNIEKFTAQQDWGKLYKEQVNAKRTVQQIQASIRDANKTKHLVRESDLGEFERFVGPVRDEALSKLQHFLSTHCSADSHDALSPQDTLDTEASSLLPSPEDTLRQRQVWAPGEELEKHARDMRSVAESWEALEKDVTDVQDMMQDLATVVHSQQTQLDSISDNIDKSHTNVKRGVTFLSKASKLKTAMFPVGGAVLGGLLGGPVGFVAGLKLGVAAGVGGGVIGFGAGRFVKKKTDKANEIAMTELRTQLRGNDTR